MNPPQCSFFNFYGYGFIFLCLASLVQYMFVKLIYVACSFSLLHSIPLYEYAIVFPFYAGWVSQICTITGYNNPGACVYPFFLKYIPEIEIMEDKLSSAWVDNKKSNIYTSCVWGFPIFCVLSTFGIFNWKWFVNY